jgi:V/A-type H+/Na+-transporting ATPase subunit F
VNFFCIADEDTVRGFRLAGVAGRAVTTAEEAAAALTHATAQPDLGILVLTQKVAAGIRDRIDAFRLERDQPLLVEIPGPEGPLPERKSLRELVHSAVGVCVSDERGAPE